MAVSFTKFSWWAWKSKDKEKGSKSGTLNSPLNSTSEFCLREMENVKFRYVNGIASSRKVKRKWPSREQRGMDREYDHDAVMVPSDGNCLSGSESGDPDWSIGWLEPHVSEFLSEEDETDNSFAVLVPCYRSCCKEVAHVTNIVCYSRSMQVLNLNFIKLNNAITKLNTEIKGRIQNRNREDVDVCFAMSLKLYCPRIGAGFNSSINLSGYNSWTSVQWHRTEEGEGNDRLSPHTHKNSQKKTREQENAGILFELMI